MKNLQISEEKAKELYKDASKDFKVLLEETFGKAFFLGNVMDRINDWNDMLNETGRPDVPEFSDVPKDLRPYFKAVYKNIVMVEAYNEGDRINIYDSSKARHYPFFNNGGSPSGFRFSYSYCGCSDSCAGSGSRLSLKSSNLAKHVGVKHVDFYRDMLEF